MNSEARERYYARFQRVLHYIEVNLEADLSVDHLGDISAFSSYHFHRQFSELFGIGVYKYIQALRLKRAAYKLAYRDDPIVDIALGSGYESPEAFSRAFKSLTGHTPGGFRKQPQWDGWDDHYQPIKELRHMHMSNQNAMSEIEIVDFKEVRVAALEHRGDPAGIGASIRKFIEWRKSKGLSPQKSDTYNIFYNNPEEVPPEEFGLDICAAASQKIAPNDAGIIAKTIPAGRCAMLRYTGSDDSLGKALHALYAEWLPQSGEEARDFPLFCKRVKFFPDVAENEAVTDIFLPLQ